MFTSEELEALKRAALTGIGAEEPKDISMMQIDRAKPLVQRIEKFVSEVKNPYLFRVGDVKVRVEFSGTASISERVARAINTENCRPESWQTPMK